IYREYPAAVWTLYDSVPYSTTSYIDTITICSVNLNYQIVLPNAPCDYTSNIVGGNFQDMLTPDIPIIDYVSIDTLSNSVLLSWNQNAQPDTYGYIVYILNPSGIVVPLDTVWGIGNTTYSHITNVDDGPLTYTVSAFDSCWTTSIPPSYQTSAKAPLNTSMFLNSTLNICDQNVDLSWSEYIGWTATDHYDIYGHKAGGAWINFGSSTTTSFTASVEDANTYCFAVQAINDIGATSFSNQSCIYIAIPGQPSFNYLQVATVNGNSVDLIHYVDNSVSISKLSIQRQNEIGVFKELARVPVSGVTVGYTDNDADVFTKSYTYRVQIIDSCGELGLISNEAQTILLRVNNDDVAKLNYLSWNSYRQFNGSILGYNIYRGINGTFSGTPLASVGSGEYTFEDDVNAVVSTGEICYSIEAVEGMNIYGFSERSLSNERCIVLPPTIYIPNAFSPDGDEFNQIFSPVVSDFDPTDYAFTVFNRWGQPMFRTTVPGVGWDGMVNNTGQMAATGTYLYMLILKDGNGLEVIKRGHVTLLK
ncbi:MAG: gliding motility-associated C-terminal domain-containing protein, partial [Crocinitomicaceae bacterium]|nr:gliding motility-associated C-terminal domain-containing protein [Crocinitomicaceae bacterium]